MPNDCQTTVTIYADAETIRAFTKAGHNLPELVKEHTLPDGLHLYNYDLKIAGIEAMIFTVESAWRPVIPLFKALMVEYPIFFFKVEWYVEDGAAGIWIAEPAKAPNAPPIIKYLEWDEGCLEAKHELFQSPEKIEIVNAK
jgi:hypothetical protein